MDFFNFILTIEHRIKICDYINKFYSETTYKKPHKAKKSHAIRWKNVNIVDFDCFFGK